MKTLIASCAIVALVIARFVEAGKIFPSAAESAGTRVDKDVSCVLYCFAENKQSSPLRTVPQVGIRGRGGMVGCETDPFPSFQRGGCATNKKSPFLSGAVGVVSDFRQKIRIAARAYKEATRPFTNHPGAARHPSLKTEGNGAVSEPTHFCHRFRNSLPPHHIHSFRNVWDRTALRSRLTHGQESEGGKAVIQRR